MDEIDAGEFVKAINNLRVNGGGDCPEYTFTGMLEALYQDPQWGSPMYVFTDAGPKDATDENIEEVKLLVSAEEYGVTINFFTTGECNDILSYCLVSSRNMLFASKRECHGTNKLLCVGWRNNYGFMWLPFLPDKIFFDSRALSLFLIFNIITVITFIIIITVVCCLNNVYFCRDYQGVSLVL